MWGVGFGHFRLEADPHVLEYAEEILRPWLEFATGEPLGEWKAVSEGGGWRLFSPEALRPLLSSWGATCPRGTPDFYPTVEHLIRAVEFQATASAILHPRSPLGMHGALLDRHGQGVAVVGDKEAGKSTLSAAAWQAGFELYSDDGFFLESDALTARPVPRRSRLREGAREHFSPTFWDQLAARTASFSDQDGSLLFHPEPSKRATRLRVIILLSAQPGPLERLSSTDALVDLARHTYRFVVSGAPASLRQLQPVTERVACYRMGRADLDEQLRRVEELLR